MKKTFLRSATLAALILFTATIHMVAAAELAPKDIPSNVTLDQAVAATIKPAEAVPQPVGITMVANENVVIDSASRSDVFAAGSSITVTAAVDGDIFAAGNDITIAVPNGDVTGSLRIAGNNVTVDTTVKRNAFIVGNTVHIAANAVITGDTHIYAKQIVVDGTLVGPTTLTGQDVTINGSIPSKSVINKTTQNYHSTLTWNSSFGFGLWLASTFFFLLFGILLLMLWPKWFEGVALGMKQHPGATWTKGLLAFFITPVAILFLCITILGIPLAVALTLAYIASLVMGRLFTGMVIGYELVHQNRFAHETKQRIAYFAIGYFVLSCVLLVPIVGWIVKILACIWGMGGMIHFFKHKPV